MPQADYQRKTTPGIKKLIERICDKLARDAEFYAASLLPDGQKKGTNWIARSPFREDKSLGSFQVSLSDQNAMPAGKFKDFATGETGDLLDIWLKVRGGTYAQVANELTVGLTVVPNPVPLGATPSDWTAVIPAPAPPTQTNFRHETLGYPTATWSYQTPTGELAGYACRFEKTDGSKETRILCYCRKDNLRFWMYRNWPGVKPRPLFNAQRLSANPDLPVLVVEGEKCAEAAQALLADFVVVTWPLGANGVRAADWSLLAGRNVTVWPDNDAPGMSAAKTITGIIAGKVMQVPEGKPEGWDVADAIKDGADSDALRSMIAVSAKREAPKPPEPPARVDIGREGFRILGVHDNRVWLFQREGMFFIGLKESEIKSHKATLASHAYWFARYGYDNPETGKREFSMPAAIDSMMREGYSKTQFDPTEIRGRGAWVDAGRPIYNAGCGIIHEDKLVSYDEFETEYTYEPGQRRYIPGGEVGRVEDGKAYFSLAKRFNWDASQLAPQLVAGWVFLAGICGALKWRPHIHIGGSHGNGKTETLRLLVSNMLRDTALVIEGASTEAGIRQSLGSAALPIIFDEADGPTVSAAERMQSIMELARVASSNDAAKVVKGSAGGTAVQYHVRTMMAHAGIAAAASLAQDKSRFTYLVLNKNEAHDAPLQYASLQKDCEALITPDFRRRIHMRAIKNIMMIRKNAETFSAVAGAMFKNRRAGDQLGTLLAGYWTLTHDDEVTPEQARAVVAEHAETWDATRNDNTLTSDQQCLEHLLLSQIEVDDGNRVWRQPVERVVAKLLGQHDEKFVADDGYLLAALKSHGMHIIGKRLFVASSHPQLTRLFAGSPFAKQWGSYLKRLPGSITPDNGIRLYGNYRPRGTLVLPEIEAQTP